MPVATMPSGLVVGHRKWKFKDMRRWAEAVEDGGDGDRLMAEASTSTLERVIDPGPYGFLKEGATAIDAGRLLKVDVLWWLYCARAASVPDNPERGTSGDDYVFDWQCSKNPKHNVLPKSAKLSELLRRSLPESSAEHLRTGKPFTKKLLNGDTVSFVLATVDIDKPARDLAAKKTRLARAKKRGAKAIEPTQAEVVACQVPHISALGENQSLERRAEYIDELDYDAWLDLKEAMDKASPALNLKVDCVCDECSGKTTVTLPLTPGFFYPGVDEAEATTEPEETDGETKALETSIETPTSAPRPG